MGIDEAYYIDTHEGKHYDRSKTNEYLKKCSKMNGKDSKKCKECGVVKPITAENFYRDKYRPDGFKTKCKECVKKVYHEKKKTKVKKNKNKAEAKKTNNSDNEISIYEWVKSLPEDKRNLLDQTKISTKIKEELFEKK